MLVTVQITDALLLLPHGILVYRAFPVFDFHLTSWESCAAKAGLGCRIADAESVPHSRTDSPLRRHARRTRMSVLHKFEQDHSNRSQQGQAFVKIYEADLDNEHNRRYSGRPGH